MRKLILVSVLFVLFGSMVAAVGLVQRPSFDAVGGFDDGVYSLYYKGDTPDKFAYKTERQRLKYLVSFDLDDSLDWHGYNLAYYGGEIPISATKQWPKMTGNIESNSFYATKSDDIVYSLLQNKVALALANPSNPNQGMKTLWSIVQNKFGEWYVLSLGDKPLSEELDEVVDFNYDDELKTYTDKSYGNGINAMIISGIPGMKLYRQYFNSRHDDSVRMVATTDGIGTGTTRPKDILVFQKSNIDVSIATPFGVRVSSYGGLPALKIFSPEGKKLFIKPANIYVAELWLFKEPTHRLMMSCNDASEENDIYKAGNSILNIKNEEKNFSDFCESGKLVEYYCDGKYLKKSVYDCNCKMNKNICDGTRIPELLSSEIIMFNVNPNNKVLAITGFFNQLRNVLFTS